MAPIHRRAFGLALRTLRKQAGFSQEQLAAAVDVSRTYISDMERGARDPRLGIVSRLAEVFRIPAAGLVAEYERNCKLFEECKDTHIVDFDVEDRVLIVTLGGTAETNACLGTWRQVLGIAQEKRVNAILMNALAMDGAVGIRDHHLIDKDVASQIAERQMDVRRAMVGNPPTVIQVATLGNESGNAAVFTTVEEALRWLKAA